MLGWVEHLCISLFLGLGFWFGIVVFGGGVWLWREFCRGVGWRLVVVAGGGLGLGFRFGTVVAVG